MNNQKGFTLVMVLLLTLMVTLMATFALNAVNSDIKVASIERNVKQAFIIAESGAEEARGRLNPAASTAIIPDNTPGNINWKAFIGTLTKCQELGFDNTNSNHFRYDSVAGNNYTVVISHKLNVSNQVLKWGDANIDGKPEENTTTGEPIYVVMSTGMKDGAAKTIRTEIARVPPISFPAAFYSRENVKVHGSSTIIKGDTIPGILSKAGINISGGPTINGTPPMITGSPIDMDVNGMIESLKGSATSSHTPANIPSNWGVPVEGAVDSPMSCATSQVVYIEGNVSLNGSSGCGTLMVKGDLALHGGFKWYGPILVSGDVTYTGGGQKNITGGIMSGGLGDVNDIGGNAVILYSSTAINYQTTHSPLITLKWEEKF